MTAAIEISDLVIQRGTREVLHGFRCAIPAGSVTGLLGPSGSGKTTLMRAMVGVQKVKSGQVQVLGKPAGHPQLRAQVGYLTQAPSIYADLTVRENAHFFASLYKGVSPKDADAVVEGVGLADHATALVGDLSGGQKARASLACTLIGRPRVLILDEPTVGQDPVLRDELWQQFRAAAADGTTVVVSSHVMDEAGRCDRLLLIRDGNLVADGTPAAIRSATGTNDLEAAFLHLIRSGQTVLATTGVAA